MPDPKLIQQIMQMLPMLMGGTFQGQQGHNPYGSHMNQLNTGQLQTPMMSSMMGGMFPGMQAQAGPTMTQADLRDSQFRQRQQTQTEQKYVLAPSLKRMMSGAGILDQFQNPETKKLTWKGMLATQAYNKFAGGALGDPYADQARRANVTRDVMSGVFFGKTGGQGGFGMSEEAIQAHTERMTGLAKTPGLMRASKFKARDLFDAQNLGAERGLFTGAGEGDVSKRTEAMAGTIKTGMAVFKSMKKEKVLDMIQELTAGTVPMSNSGQLNRALFQISTMAKQANVSIEIMQRTAAEGAAIYKKMGIGGTAGAMQAVGGSRMAQLTTSRLGGQDPIVSQDTLGRMPGGQRGFGAFIRQTQAQRFGSKFMKSNIFLLDEAQKTGTLTAKEAEAFEARIGSGDISSRQQNKLIAKIAADSDRTPRQIRNLMRMNSGREVENFMEDKQRKGKGYELDRMARGFRLSQLERNSTGLRESLAGGVADTERGREDQIANIVQAEMQARRGIVRDPLTGRQLSKEEGRAFLKGRAEQMLLLDVGQRNKVGSPQRIASDKRRAAVERTAKVTQMKVLGDEALENMAQGGTFVDRLRVAVAGEDGVDPASLMGALESTLMGEGSELEQYISSRVAGGKELDPAKKEALMDLATKATQPQRLARHYAQQVIFRRNKQTQGLQGLMTGITGDRFASMDNAFGEKGFIKKAQRVVAAADKHKDVKDFAVKLSEMGQFTGTKKEAMDKAKNFFRNRGVNQKSLQEFAQKELRMDEETAKSAAGSGMALRIAQDAKVRHASDFRDRTEFAGQRENQDLMREIWAKGIEGMDPKMLRRISQGEGSPEDIEELRKFSDENNLGVKIVSSEDAKKAATGMIERGLKRATAERVQQSEMARARFEDRGSGANIMKKISSRFLDEAGQTRGKQIFEKFKAKGVNIGSARAILKKEGISGLAAMIAKQTGETPSEQDLAATVGAIRGFEKESGKELTKPEELRLGGGKSETLGKLLELKDQGKLREAMNPTQILESVFGKLFTDTSETAVAAKEIAANTKKKGKDEGGDPTVTKKAGGR